MSILDAASGRHYTDESMRTCYKVRPQTLPARAGARPVLRRTATKTKDYGDANVPDNEEHELVHLTTVQTSGEAEVARLALQAEGIDCQIVGESQAGLSGVLPIKIYVRPADLDRAKTIAGA